MINRLQPNNLLRWRYKVLAFAALITLWEIIALLINNQRLIPSTAYLLTVSLPSLASFSAGSNADFTEAIKVLVFHTTVTLSRIIVGLTLGIIAGFSVGLLIHSFGRSRKGHSFLLTIVRSIPLFALIPLFLLWFGGREFSIYLYIAFSAFVVFATDTYESILNITPNFINHAKIMGASKFQIIKTVTVFAIQPQLVGSLRNILGLCWAFSLGAEYMSAKSGIGYLLYQSYLYSDMGKLIVIGMIYIILGSVSFIATMPAFKLLKQWNTT